MTINGEEPHKILRVCDTRWINQEPAIRRILQQWVELKLHFEIARSSESCYTGDILFQMYSDITN